MERSQKAANNSADSTRKRKPEERLGGKEGDFVSNHLGRRRNWHPDPIKKDREQSKASVQGTGKHSEDREAWNSDAELPQSYQPSPNSQTNDKTRKSG